jgi:hypothetical protein
MSMRNKLILLCALLLLPLSGCGIISIGYNYAEAYLRYSINSYATFNDAQKENIKQDVHTFMAWHRKTMLPEYAGFLQEIQKIVQSGAPLKAEDVRRFRIETRALYIKTLSPVVAPAARLLSEVDERQVEEFSVSFARENGKQRDKELSGSREDQLRRRTERSIDFMENLVGSFTDSQLEQIREMNLRLPYATPLYIAQREGNQARLLALLKSKKGETEIEALLKEWLIAPDASRGADERITIQAFENGSDEMIANVYQLLNDKQKKALLKSIAKYINTFQELASSK